MKRTDITDTFPEATPEQIDRLMGINGADINAAKKGIEDLQTQLAAAKDQLNTPSDELKAAQKQAKDLQAEIDKMKAAEGIRTMREQVATANGIPAALLTGSTEEDCTAQAQAIMAFAKNNGGYPVVRDAGETKINHGKKDTRDQFAEWFNKLQ